MAITIELPSGERVSVSKDIAVVGSDERCDVRLAGLEPRHARIRKVASRWLIESLGAGTIQVRNGEATRIEWLSPGDDISLTSGGLRLTFEPKTAVETPRTSVAEPRRRTEPTPLHTANDYERAPSSENRHDSGLPSNEVRKQPRTTPPPLPSERARSEVFSSPNTPPQATHPVRELPKTTPPPLPSERLTGSMAKQAETAPPEPESDETDDDSKSPGKDERIASWIFGAILLTFFLGVFIFAPKELPEFKQRMLAIFSALLAGLFGFFFTGHMNLELKLVEQAFGDLGVKATGGAALFVLMLAWWLSPLAPVKSQLALKPIQYFASTNQISVMDKDVRSIEYSFDEKTWRPVDGFHVTQMGFEGVEHASARLDPAEKNNHRKVFIKYTTKDGAESSVKAIDYDPKESVYPKSVVDALREGQETFSRAMTDLNRSKARVENIGRDSNTFYLTLEDKKLSRAEFSRLGKLPELMDLKLIECEFEDSDLEALEPASMLRSLSLSRSTISDDGLKHIAKLGFVTELDLSGTKITDQGIVYLVKMRALTCLNLDKTQVTGEGFARCDRFFSKLTLRGSKLKDQNAKYLGTAKLGQVGQSYQSRHSIASELDLGDTLLTDSGLKYLETCTQFQKLKIDGTKVTAAGVDSLKRRFPHLRLEW